MLAIIAAAVPSDGHRRVKPSANFSPIAQPISRTPAATRSDHADILHLQGSGKRHLVPHPAIATASGLRRGRPVRLASRGLAYRGTSSLMAVPAQAETEQHEEDAIEEG